MNGPAAPKDPEKKRPYFYIMKDKEIFGAKQEDGSAIHFIYESDGRLINSAQIVGNITDENMLRLLETVEGFGKLVHSIGVSVETDNQRRRWSHLPDVREKRSLRRRNQSAMQPDRRRNGTAHLSVGLYLDRG